MFCMLKRQKHRRVAIQNLRRNSQRMDRQSGAPLIAFMARAIAIIEVGKNCSAISSLLQFYLLH